jgi:hypothetical protein
MADRRPAIFPARRAIERAVSIPGARPTRFFALLLPVCCVEIRTTVRETQPHEVFDRFLGRAIAEAQITDADDLAAFFGIRRSLVDRALRFLGTLGHVEQFDDNVRLTALGAESVRDGCRYVIKEDRQKLYFDAFTSAPLPDTHYTGVTYLAEPTLTGVDRTRFQQLTSLEPFRNDALAALLTRPDRRKFNIPDGLRDAEVLTTRQEWLPAYLVQNAGNPPYLAFTMAVDGRDQHVEWLAAAIADTLATESDPDTAKIWRQWLDTNGFPDIQPRKLPSGVLRATLPATAFGSNGIGLYRLGSFETRQSSFLQLWCDDEKLRRRTVLERASQRITARSTTTAADLYPLLIQLADQLDVPSPTIDELAWHARTTKDDLVLAVLDELAEA